MNEEQAPPTELPSRRFAGRVDFQQLVRDAFAAAAREGWREIILSDAYFADWPLGERAIAESLNAWAGSGRRFTILAKKYDEVVRRHARFVTWRKTWSHIIEARAVPAAEPLELPSAIWTPAWVMERRDLEDCAGFCGSEPQRRLELHQALKEWLLKSTPSFPSSTSGL
ncbi:hypothetical protein [Ramlibacter albus]|uniref:hypothetical protein n=1 Tax=Ramlibacter albus TaxID=2079448 RepID=UPI00338EDC3F